MFGIKKRFEAVYERMQGLLDVVKRLVSICEKESKTIESHNRTLNSLVESGEIQQERILELENIVDVDENELVLRLDPELLKLVRLQCVLLGVDVNEAASDLLQRWIRPVTVDTMDAWNTFTKELDNWEEETEEEAEEVEEVEEDGFDEDGDSTEEIWY